MQQLLRRRSFVAALPATLAARAAAAQDAYPTRPVKLVVGFPPGGPTDVIGRMIASNLMAELGPPVVIENLGGAGGTIAAAYVARSAADGYTLLVSVESSQTRARALYPAIRYDQVGSFTFLRKLAKQRNLLVTNPNLPVASVADLIAYAKARPGQLSFGGTVGATSHVGGTIFNRLNDIDMTFISYAGGNQPVTDLMTGTIQVGFFTESTVAELVRNGRIRALAVTALERSPAFPDLPTVQEAGGGRLDISPWFGLVGPAGLPAPVVRRLFEAAERISRKEAFRAQIETIGASPIRDSNPETFRSEVEEEIRFWSGWAEQHRAQLP
ncbi:tripartite tricarboxylate transporter substrate binding protein [Roseomonas hellenica]|uniref:Tripartite tricarboxylate transporter substrate binding protein n=1 Tax=Plastoroseomonas hellenica TaxID=2687306 RepID=A0ABS5EYU6_9PROT|nr:tripartite tricarboxylate transporter substrate binding protein [Plastoroseomonas hellenica]